MKKNVLILLLAFILVFSFSGLAFAVAPEQVPGGTVNIDPIADLQLTQEQLNAGHNVNVAGYVGFNVPDSNHGRLDTLTLEVENNSTGERETIQSIDNDPPLNSIILTARGEGVTGREFGFTTPWTISSVGSYTLKVTATFTSGFGGSFDTEGVEVTLSTIIVDYPAAPAVAAAILQDNGIANRYNTGEVDSKNKAIYGNYISDVALMMGSSEEDQNGSWFMGIDKTDVKAYYDAVYEYLIYLKAPLK